MPKWAMALSITAVLIAAGITAVAFHILNGKGWATFSPLAGGFFTLVVALGALFLPRGRRG